MPLPSQGRTSVKATDDTADENVAIWNAVFISLDDMSHCELVLLHSCAIWYAKTEKYPDEDGAG